MKIKKSNIFRTLAAAVAIIILTALSASAAELEFVLINTPVSYTGLEAPGYTFKSSSLNITDDVGAMVFNISIALPLEGDDPTWNDWCGEAVAVTANGETKYYDFGGAQVGWGVDFNGDGEADTGGVGTDSWAGTAANGTCTVTLPINASDFSVDFYDNCWDTATDIPHYIINSAAIIYGSVEATETIDINEEITFSGADGAQPAYSRSFTTDNDLAAAVFNISINLPLEGDPSWNDWCGEAMAVTSNFETKYYDFGGAQVSWGADIDGDGEADTGGVGTDSWAGTAENGSISVVVPLSGKEFSVSFYDNCWDTVEGAHFTINSATLVYGAIAAGGDNDDKQVEPKSIPPFNANGSYNVFLGIQSKSYTFRNAWADESYGASGKDWANQPIGNNFFGLTGWDGGDAVVKNGLFTDVEIKGNGTYRVELNDYDFGDDDSLNLLFLSTDIPLEGNNITFKNVAVFIGGSKKYTFDKGFVPGVDNTEAKDYYEVHCINIWSEDLGGADGLFGYVLSAPGPIALEFTVEGFAYDKAEEGDVIEPAPANTPTVTASDTASAESVFPVWLIIVIIVGVIAIIVIVVMSAMKSKK